MKRAVLIGLVLVAVALGVAFVLRTSDENAGVDSVAAPQQRQLPDTSGMRPSNRPQAVQPGEQGGDHRESAVHEEVEAKFRSLVEALHRLQQRARQAQDARAAADPSRSGAAEPKIWAPDRDGIRGAVRSVVPDLRECYEEWLKLNPSLQGRLVVSFEIAASEDNENVATVVDAKVKEGGLGNQLLDGCVVASFSTLQFEVPPDGGTMSVNYPLMFRSDSPAADP